MNNLFLHADLHSHTHDSSPRYVFEALNMFSIYINFSVILKSLNFCCGKSEHNKKRCIYTMDDQTSSEEEITAGKLQTDLTDSGVSSSVASDDSILKHKVLQHMNGLAIEDLQSSSTLSSSLQEGLEKTELLLTTSNPLGLSSVSLEVRTSGEQLNLLAEGLESPPESVSGRSQEDEVEGTKTRECGEPQRCRESDMQCEYMCSCDVAVAHPYGVTALPRAWCQ